MKTQTTRAQTMKQGGATTSAWVATASLREYSELTEDAGADVCVVGAGIAGLSVAYSLAQEGKSVLVIDDGPVGAGETSRTTAHLSNVIDDTYREIERLHGREGARLAFESHSAAIQFIEDVVRRENIDCDFERLDGFLFAPPGEDESELDEELEAAHRAGFASAEKCRQTPLPGKSGLPCLRFPQQGQFHVLKYLGGLLRCIEQHGGRIFTGTAAEKVEPQGEGTRAAVSVSCRNGATITANAVVVATNSPFNVVEVHLKQHPYRTYVSVARIPAGSVEKALFWDTLDPYHYVRLQKLDEAHDLLIVGGEDHKTGQEDDGAERHAQLEEWMREYFPMSGEIVYRWSGQVLEPIDGLAFIGRDQPEVSNVYIATGDSGMGITHGTIAGILLTDLIMGRENPWAKLYDPSRRTLKAGAEWLRESGNMGVQYKDWLTPGDVDSPEEIAVGEGAILRRGLTKIAAYRDDGGKLHECSAVCPHLQCIVAWNSQEKTWDCPCHGSRFGPTGGVLNGPAATDLAPASQDED